MLHHLFFGSFILKISYIFARNTLFLQNKRNSIKRYWHLPCHYFSIILRIYFFGEMLSLHLRNCSIWFQICILFHKGRQCCCQRTAGTPMPDHVFAVITINSRFLLKNRIYSLWITVSNYYIKCFFVQTILRKNGEKELSSLFITHKI